MNLRKKDSAANQLTVDDFASALQKLLVHAPYSKDVRSLKKFAKRNHNPAYQNIFDSKWDLFENQQLEIRPSGFLPSALYRLEKAVSGLLSTKLIPALSVASLVALFAYGVFFLDRDKNRKFYTYQAYVDGGQNFDNEDESFEARLLRSLNNEEFLEELDLALSQSRKIPTTKDSPRPENNNTTNECSEKLKKCLNEHIVSTLDELPLPDEEKSEFSEWFAKHKFASLVAEKVASDEQVSSLMCDNSRKGTSFAEIAPEKSER